MENTSKRNMASKLAYLICYKDRPTELSLLLQSIRTQTFKGGDIYILDDQSGTPLQTYHFFNCIFNRMKIENYKIFIKRTEFPHGVSKARQACVDWALENDYTYLCRLDDDVVLEPDYIERLFKVIEKGYDMASGVTVPMMSPVLKRDPKFLNGIANRVILNEGGEYIMNGDDCGFEYTESVIIPAHHFRSCALYKSEIHKKANYLPTKLGLHGFREEQFFSYKIIMAGYKIGVDTGAINYHQMTPSGGERQTTSETPYNQQMLEEFTKKHSNELRKLFPNEPMPTELELSKENNLLMK